jgi:bifunctional ADP-heptose synthase (sugar kinase/adenylyltransferase)
MVFDEIAQDTYLGGAGLVAQTLANIAPEEVEITLEGSLPPMYEKLLNPRIKLNRVSEEAMIKTRYVASGQGRPDKPWGSQKIIRVDNIKKFKQSTKVEDSARDGYDYVVISDYNKGTVPIGFKVASTNPMVIADTKSNTLTKYNRVDLLKINQSEYQTLQTEIANVKHTVITYGRKPVEVKNFGYKAYTVPTYELSIHDRVEYDPCGAGDSFLAGLIVGTGVARYTIIVIKSAISRRNKPRKNTLYGELKKLVTLSLYELSLSMLFFLITCVHL